MKIPVLCLGLSLALAASAIAQETQALTQTDRSILQATEEAAVLDSLEPRGFNKGDYLTGDWWGYRERLLESGVEVFAFYNSILSGNVSGGIDPGNATYDLDAWVGLKFDLEKLVGWQGGKFIVSGVIREGPDLTTKYIGSIYSTQQLVGGQRAFLYQLYFQQQVYADQLTLKLGRFGASDDFNTSPLYGYSLNNGINGNIRNVLFDTRFSAYPFATWAAALMYEPKKSEFSGKLGVFQVSQGMFENDDHGLNFGIAGNDGYLAAAQFIWAPEFFKKPVSTGSADGKTASSVSMKGLPGHYWIGATFSQWDFYERFLGGFEDHSYGFYAHADQMVYQEAPGSDQGLIAWVASGYYPQEEISIVPFQINLGLNYKGLIPGRNEDRTMLHFIYGDLSRDYARSVRVPGGGNPESEKVVEFAYRVQITPWSYIQPDIQWVIDPGGTGDIPDAVVIGAQMGLTF